MKHILCKQTCKGTFFFLFILDVQADLFCSSNFDAFEEVLTHRDLGKGLFFRASDAQVSQMGRH